MRVVLIPILTLASLGTSVEPLTLEDCLQPFVTLLRSPDLNGSIVGAVLSSVARFFRERLFQGLGTLRAYRALVLAVARCRIDSPEIVGDEAALQRILDVLLLALRASPLSRRLARADICLIVETAFSICVLPRSGDLLRRQAELSCIEICRTLFARLDPNDDLVMDVGQTGLDDEKLPSISYPGTRADDPEPLPPALAALEAELKKVEATKAGGNRSDNQKKSPSPSVNVSASASRTSTPPPLTSAAKPPSYPMNEIIPANPYDLGTLMEVLNHLLRLLEIGEKRNTDRMRSLCLLIFTDLIECHSERIQSLAPLWDLISMRLTKVIIQLMNQESPQLMTHLHQLILTVFGRYRRALIVPFELFWSSLMTLLNQRPPPGTTGNKTLRISKEYYLEIVLHFCLDPTFLGDLYVWYECGPRFGYVLGDLVSSLAMTAMIDPRQLSGAAGGGLSGGTNAPDNSHYMALDMILSLLRTFSHLGAIDEEAAAEALPEHLRPARLAKERQMKSLTIQSVELFNNDPKEAFAFLLEHKLISSTDDPAAVAKYLRRTAGLDKRAVGELISKPSNLEILREYLADFHFAGLEIDEALRSVLESFRLPGEAQQIGRIMEVFAQIYYRDANQRGTFKNEDAVYVLAYSIVMLNTDQHNKQVRHRMTLEEFIRNNRGINGKENFPPAFLERIYYAIREKEIVMPEEQGAEAAFNFIWNEQWKKMDEAHHISSDANLPDVSLYATDILTVAWRPFLHCFRALILSPRTDATTKMAVRGLSELGAVAERFLGTAQSDEVVAILAEALSCAEIAANLAGNQLARYVARSELFKLLIRCFWDQFRLHGQHMRMAWKTFVTHLMMLFQAGILSLATFEVEPGLGLSPRPSTPQATTKSSATSESGLFSALSQYLTAAASPTVDAHGVDPETRNKAIEYLRTCRLPDIIRDTRFLEEDALRALLGAMIEQVPLSSSRQQQQQHHHQHQQQQQQQSQQTQQPQTPPSVQQPWETDALVFLTDLAVATAWINRDRMGVFWEPLFGRLSALAKELGAPSVLREHCILGLGRLSLRFAERPEMQRQVVQFFQLLCYVPPEAFSSLAEPALSIVLRIVELDPPLLRETAIWPHYFTVLALAGRSKSCGPYSYGLLTTIVREEEILFPLEFYSEYVDLLNGFVASATTMTMTGTSNASSGATEASPASPMVTPSQVDLALQALQKFTILETHVRRMASQGQLPSGSSLWRDFVVPVHCAIAQQCYHPVRDLRTLALSLLQRTILSVDFGGEPLETLLEEFTLVLLPLLEELQRPELRQLEGNNVEEIQTRAAAVLSKFFLSNMGLLFVQEEAASHGRGREGRREVEALWIGLLRGILRFLEPGRRSDVLRESIPETVKNMLLVMASSGVLRPPRPGEEGSLWRETWTLLDPVMPRAKVEITELTLPGPMSKASGSPLSRPDQIGEADEGLASEAGPMAGKHQSNTRDQINLPMEASGTKTNREDHHNEEGEDSGNGGSKGGEGEEAVDRLTGHVGEAIERASSPPTAVPAGALRSSSPLTTSDASSALPQYSSTLDV